MVEGGDSLGFGGVGLGIGPFLEHDAVEPFDFAVGLGSVGAGAFVCDVVAESLFEGVGAVAGAVVSQDSCHGDPGGVEEGVGALPGRGGGFLLLVGQDFAVGQAGVVVDGVVDVGIPGPAVRGGSGLVPGTRGTAPPFVAAAVGDPAAVLDVDVDQVAGGGMLVAAFLGT